MNFPSKAVILLSTAELVGRLEFFFLENCPRTPQYQQNPLFADYFSGRL